MKNLKKRMAILLTLIMIVPSIITCLPTAALTSQAASTGTIEGLYWTGWMSTNSKGTGKLVMQVGQSVKTGGLIDVGGSGDYNTALNLSGKFYTSNPKVASFDKNGTLTAKKSGKIKITCTYEGHKIRCNVTVLKKGSIKEASSSAVKKFTKNVNALEKIVKKGINSKNCYTIYNKLVSLSTQWDKVRNSFLDKNIYVYDGLLTKFKEDKYYSETCTYTNKLVVPAYYTYKDITEKLNLYLYDQTTSFTSGMGLEFKSTKITVKNTKKSTKITVKLANKITKKEFFNIWVSRKNDEKFDASKEITTYIYINRKTADGYDYPEQVLATIKCGSDKIQVKTFAGKLSKGTYQFYNDAYKTKFITGTFKVK
jgi:hypothetical protein